VIIGRVRDYLPRVRLSLRGRNGEAVPIDFTLDTGFDGDLALPAAVLDRLDAVYLRERVLLMANGSFEHRSAYEVKLEWNERGGTRPRGLCA
jgi:predicted aspartyl protease